MDGLIRSLTHPVAAAWRRPACLVLAVLTACFLLASATGVRTDLAARNRALQTMLDALPSSSRAIVTGTEFDGFVGQIFGTGPPDAVEGDEIAADLKGQTQSAYAALAASAQGVPLAPEADAWTSLGTPTYYVGPYSTRFIPIRQGQPEIQFTYLQDYAQHAQLVSGRWPQRVRTLSSGVYSIEIALSEANLKRLGLHVGSLFMARSGGAINPPPPIAIQVTGAYQPIDPGSAYWQDQPSDISAQSVKAKNVTPYLLTDGLFGQDELGFLASYQPFGLQDPEMTTHIPLRTASLTADRIGAYTTALDAMLTQATSNLQNQSQPALGESFLTQLAVTLAQFEAEQQAGQLETAMPAVSLALIGLIALLMAARAAVERTSAQTAVQRARGAPLWRLAGAAARDAAVTVVPAALLAAIVAALLPGQSPPRLWEYELVLPVVAVAGPAVLTVLRHRRAGSSSAGQAARGRRSPVARRFVAQGALIVLCLLGLAEARGEGFSPGGGINLFTAAAPALAAILVALVMLNLGPLLLRLLLRAVARRRGAIGLLGLARTARTPAPAAVTVLILTVALATADLTVALHRTNGKEGGAAAAAQAIYQAANYSGTSVFAAPADYGPDALVHATASYLAVLALVAVVTGCLVVALATAVEAGERRVVFGRLTTMGLTASQARAVAAVELLGPIALAAVGGTVVSAPLLWAVRPALSPALGGVNAQISAVALALPLGAVTVLAMAAGLAAAAAARRGVAGTLRLGDLAEGV